MRNTISRIMKAAESVDASGVKKYGATAAFITSLLPIAGLSQVGAICTRVLDNEKLEKRFSELEAKIDEIASPISDDQTTTTRAMQIAGLAETNGDIRSLVLEIAEQLENFLREEGTRWHLETRDYSYQEILNSSVTAEHVSIEADDHSENLLRGNTFDTIHTHLKATGHSKNRVHDTSFAHPDGSSVNMFGSSLSGDVSVQGSMVSFGENGVIEFEAPLVARCSSCGYEFEIQRSALVGYSHVICPNPSCGKTAKIGKIPD